MNQCRSALQVHLSIALGAAILVALAPVPLGALAVSQDNRRVGSPIVTPARRGWGRDSCPVARHHGWYGPAVPPLIGPPGLLEGVPRRGVAGTEVLGLWVLHCLRPAAEVGVVPGGRVW